MGGILRGGMMRLGVFLVLLAYATALEAEADAEVYYDESVPADGDSNFLSTLQNVTLSSRTALSNTLKQEIINLLYDAAREGNGTVEAMEISPDDIHLPQNAGDTAQLYGIPEMLHDYLKGLGLTPFVRRSATVQHPRDKYDYTYKLMVSWMPPNGAEPKNVQPVSSRSKARSKASASNVLLQDKTPALVPQQ